MNYENKTVLIYGYGESGKSALKFLQTQKANVIVYDDNLFSNSQSVFSVLPFNKIDYAIISPGVDVNCDNVQTLKKHNIKLKSELELGLEFYQNKLICITGTNGKTTSVNLLHHIFNIAHRSNFLCGNVGIPVTSQYEKFDSEYAICEISSFQMETTNNINSFASCILNIEPDHLNRHKTMKNYILLKEKILKNAENIILNYDNKICNKLIKKYKNNSVFTKNSGILCENNNYFINNLIFIKNNCIFFNNEKIINLNKIKLLGDKNLENVLACILICKLCSIDNKYISKGISTFKPLAHRLEIVKIVNNIKYVNDSKATNLASTLCAVNAFKNQSLILLIGGIAKEKDFTSLFSTQFKSIIFYGKSGEFIFNQCNIANKHLVSDFFTAFNMAKNITESGDVVLLSPACASFDEFKNYEERGNCFKNLVNKLDN